MMSKAESQDGIGKGFKEFEERVLQVSRVTKVVKGGKNLSFRGVVVVGNRSGKVGIGIGKATEVSEAVRKAIEQAKKNIISVPIINGTIPHRVDLKWKSVRLFLGPASPGTGVIAGGAVRSVLELAGISNVLSKLLQSTNALNTVYATMEGLKRLRTAEVISQRRGRQIVHPSAGAHAEAEALRKERAEAERKLAEEERQRKLNKRKTSRRVEGEVPSEKIEEGPSKGVKFGGQGTQKKTQSKERPATSKRISSKKV